MAKEIETTYVISPPKFATVDVYLEGIAPLVVERFSKKAELMAKMQEGKSAGSKKVRDARDYEKEAEDARYRSMQGWEGVNAVELNHAQNFMGTQTQNINLMCYSMNLNL